MQFAFKHRDGFFVCVDGCRLCLLRVARAQVRLAAHRGGQRSLGGMAVVVWVVLDEAGTADGRVDRIGELWPDAAVGRGRVVEALELLEAKGVIVARRPSAPG